MRIYEISKKLGVTNKEIIDLLRKQGFDVASHMSVLSDDAITYLTTHFAPKPSPNTQKPLTIAQKKDAQQEQTKNSPEPKKHFIEKNKTPVSEPKNITDHAKIVTEKDPAQEGFIIQPMTVAEISSKVGRPVNEIMLVLLKQGILSTKNQLLSAKSVEALARYYQIQTVAASSSKQQEVSQIAKKPSHGTQERLPVVVVIGHVDHGKTTLLDFIRETKVASREQGGITQHLGAYQAKTKQGSIVFLDTPGHAAFITMRARGIKVADIAILVVAADDGIMPQTVEAIKHAKKLNVPIIIAINKIDKASPAQIEAVKRGLAQYDLLPEEWGGEAICVPISAKTGEGVDQLLDMVQLQAEVMELRTDVNGPAKGFVLEARIEKGRGAVATVITQEGTIRIGDFFIAGATYGKVTSIVDSFGKNLSSVEPSLPVRIAGFEELPEAGDAFEIVEQSQHQRARSKGTHRENQRQLLTEGALNIVLKADTKSSKEAIIEAINQLNAKKEKKIQVVYAAIGDINESDVDLASTTQSSIYGFHVKFEQNVAIIAQKSEVPVHIFQIIYQLLDNLELLGKQQESVKLVSTKIGEAVVRKVFEIKNVGTIAGVYVREGRLSRNGHVIIWRGKTKIGVGPIKSLERDKKSVKEVHTGFECAFFVDGFSDWQVDDRIECFLDMPAQKS